jgi:hypothetical protein
VPRPLILVRVTNGSHVGADSVNGSDYQDQAGIDDDNGLALATHCPQLEQASKADVIDEED